VRGEISNLRKTFKINILIFGFKKREAGIQKILS
jgi:hypothetical protein